MIGKKNGKRKLYVTVITVQAKYSHRLSLFASIRIFYLK